MLIVTQKKLYLWTDVNKDLELRLTAFLHAPKLINIFQGWPLKITEDIGNLF